MYTSEPTTCNFIRAVTTIIVAVTFVGYINAQAIVTPHLIYGAGEREILRRDKEIGSMLVGLHRVKTKKKEGC